MNDQDQTDASAAESTEVEVAEVEEVSGPALPEADAAGEAAALEEADDIELADRLRAAREAILSELRKIIIGQEDVVEQVLLSLVVGGNSLVTGVPGLAKTLLIQTMAQVLDLDFSRIQFTPDLMPSDITGTDLVQEDPKTGRRELVFAPGADLRQHCACRRDQPDAPQDAGGIARGDAGASGHRAGHHLRAAGALLRFRDPEPDRARGHLPVARSTARPLHVRHYTLSTCPRDEELEVVRATTTEQETILEPVVGGNDIIAFQQLVRRVPVSEPVMQYAVDLVRTSRPGGQDTPSSSTSGSSTGPACARPST